MALPLSAATQRKHAMMASCSKNTYPACTVACNSGAGSDFEYGTARNQNMHIRYTPLCDDGHQ